VRGRKTKRRGGEGEKGSKIRNGGGEGEKNKKRRGSGEKILRFLNFEREKTSKRPRISRMPAGKKKRENSEAGMVSL